ncbi:energy transducer TonB [Winogradskyella sp.]|uniref:energy transducer TonB n=1 Tax=Winogradskyella sp. TaxID=1883156 RepID=UPI003F6B0938
MKYLETKHERNSARITGFIALILLLLLFVVGPQYMDPPEEYGVAVNFGTTDFGSGNKPLSEPRKAVEEKVVEESQPEEAESEPTETTTKAEKVMTQENAEAIAIKKQKEAEAKAKAEAERIESEKREAEERRKREEEEKTKKLDALIGGVKDADGKDDGGDGDDDKAGNSGQQNGDPYAPSQFGRSVPGKGGVGFGLGGRGKISNKIFNQDCNEEGLVVVEIRVNRSGKVIKATPGIKGTTGTSCLFEAARKTALSFKFTPNNDAPNTQVGFVSINFALGQ